MASINLKRIMKQKNIGNKALAEKSSIPIGTLNKIIYGETTNPSLDTLAALAQALDCTLDDLLADTVGESEQLAPLEAELLSAFRLLNDAGRSRLLEYVEILVESGRFSK